MQMKNYPPDIFRQGINILMLIDRGIQNSNKGSRRWINKIVTEDIDTWDRAANRLIELQNYINDPNIRLYSSINPRNMKKAIKKFQHKQLDLIQDNEASFYTRINDSFCSCLMSPENRERSFFLLDHDTKDPNELNAFLIRNNHIEQYYMYPTPNGWHAIVSPFNPHLMEGMIKTELKRDALILINWVA